MYMNICLDDTARISCSHRLASFTLGATFSPSAAVAGLIIHSFKIFRPPARHMQYDAVDARSRSCSAVASWSPHD